MVEQSAEEIKFVGDLLQRRETSAESLKKESEVAIKMLTFMESWYIWQSTKLGITKPL